MTLDSDSRLVPTPAMIESMRLEAEQAMSIHGTGEPSPTPSTIRSASGSSKFLCSTGSEDGGAEHAEEGAEDVLFVPLPQGISMPSEDDMSPLHGEDAVDTLLRETLRGTLPVGGGTHHNVHEDVYNWPPVIAPVEQASSSRTRFREDAYGTPPVTTPPDRGKGQWNWKTSQQQQQETMMEEYRRNHELAQQAKARGRGSSLFGSGGGGGGAWCGSNASNCPSSCTSENTPLSRARGRESKEAKEAQYKLELEQARLQSLADAMSVKQKMQQLNRGGGGLSAFAGWGSELQATKTAASAVPTGVFAAPIQRHEQNFREGRMAPRQGEAWGMSPAGSSVSRPRSGATDGSDYTNYASAHFHGGGNVGMAEAAYATGTRWQPQPRPCSGENFPATARSPPHEPITTYPLDNENRNGFASGNQLPRTPPDDSRMRRPMQAWETRQADPATMAGRRGTSSPASLPSRKPGHAPKRETGLRKDSCLGNVATRARAPADRARLESRSQKPSASPAPASMRQYSPKPAPGPAARRSPSTGPRGITHGRGPALHTGHGWR